ncbi:hypothetical protein ABE458_03510 [Pseudomonas protegens]|uniref:hypothetical protein n=1 Tax=Pseudomonas protegens TaxID=380021 RepID=UPI003208A085
MSRTSLSLLILMLTLPGCHSNVRDSSPSFLNDGIQLHQSTVAVDAQHAKVIMKASGYTFPVEFSVRRATDPDQRMEVLGTVVDSGRGKVLDWIAKLNEVANSAVVKRFPQLEVKADVDKPFEVSGYSYDRGVGDTYHCGPLKSTFIPERSKVYLVEFQFIGKHCEQHVYDVTQPLERIPVVSLP